MVDFDDSRPREVWFERRLVIAVPCPKCGGKVWLGDNYNWPPELGGDQEYESCVCESCKSEWLTEEAPPEFSADAEHWNAYLPDTDRPF